MPSPFSFNTEAKKEISIEVYVEICCNHWFTLAKLIGNNFIIIHDNTKPHKARRIEKT